MTKKKSLRNCVDLSELIMGMVSKVFFYAQQESKVKKCKSVLQADRTISLQSLCLMYLLVEL